MRPRRLRRSHLMMEHFRGARGNTAVVYYVLDTADRNGAYADASRLVEQP